MLLISNHFNTNLEKFVFLVRILKTILMYNRQLIVYLYW
jgi:hypothetical protein